MIIYGAQGYALGAYNAIKVLEPEQIVSCFAVTDLAGNPETLGGRPVRTIKSVSDQMSAEDRKRIRVLIATPENVQGEIEETLVKLGFGNNVRLTSDLWNDMMRRLNVQTGDFKPLSEMPAGSVMPSVKVFMAKSHKDKPLAGSYVIPEYVTPIQVGAANTDERITDLADDKGSNISAKNGNYCEMTGLYWVWKNVLCKKPSSGKVSDYYGFAQYRRVLMLTDDDLRRLAANDVDVVLPYPLMYEPDMNAHHDRYIKERDWDALLEALRRISPEYYNEALPDALGQQFMYNYNVILAKEEVLYDYCEWLFPILEMTEEMSIPKGCDRSDRYIGYMAETLETAYFMKNKDRLKIAHTGCRLFV